MDPAKKPIAAPRVAGMVLAGGRSRRFGAEKAMAMLDGRPLLDWSLAAISGCCAETAVSVTPGGGAEALAKARGLPPLLDDAAHPAGPLAGVHAGLAWAADRGFGALVTLPCDTPLVGTPELVRLIETLGTHLAAYALAGDRPQGLCAVWRVEVLDVLGERLTAGEHPPVYAFLRALHARPVIFPDASPFRNVNTPADLPGDGTPRRQTH